MNSSLGCFEFRVNPTTTTKKEVSVDGGNTWENFSSGADLLWTNSAPDKGFSPQTVSIDLSKYDAVLIMGKGYYTTTASQNFSNDVLFLNDTSKLLTYGLSNTAQYSRVVTSVKSNGVIFGTAYYNQNGTNNANNNAGIPLKIYGLNLGISND